MHERWRQWATKRSPVHIHTQEHSQKKNLEVLDWGFHWFWVYFCAFKGFSQERIHFGGWIHAYIKQRLHFALQSGAPSTCTAWCMNASHMVIIGGSKKRKLDKKHVNWTKIGGNLNSLQKKGGIYEFLVIGRNIEYASLGWGGWTPLSLITTVLNVLYCIYTFIQCFLQCTPIRSASSAWDPERREQWSFQCERPRKKRAMVNQKSHSGWPLQQTLSPNQLIFPNQQCTAGILIIAYLARRCRWNQNLKNSYPAGIWTATFQ